MGPIELFFHLLNFVAPAAWLAAVLLGLGPFLMGGRSVSLRWYWKFAINFAAGVAALGLALWLFGRDGSMAGYGLLLLAAGSSQWLLQGGWRR